MKSIADFKRKMIVGSKWKFTSSYLKKGIIVERTCTKSQSNSFALTSLRDKNQSSWCDWPKTKEVVWIHEYKKSELPGKPRESYVKGIKIVGDFGWLYYEPVLGV